MLKRMLRRLITIAQFPLIFLIVLFVCEYENGRLKRIPAKEAFKAWIYCIENAKPFFTVVLE